ncbi:hypothetical protein ACSBR2_027697 [Camellia fascicularis]
MVFLGLMVMTMSGRGEAGIGLLGAGLVLSLSWWIIVVGQFVYIVTSSRCKNTWSGFSLQIVLLLAGLLPKPKLALDSLSICLLIAGCIMMISIGFNAAVSVRVSNELAAGHDKSAAFSVAVVNLVSFILYLIAAIIVLALRNAISYAFTDGETVARAV